MLQPRFRTCPECADISVLIDKIDCKITKLGSVLYGNTIYMLNSSFSAFFIIDLLNYKRILTFKKVNPDYCKDYTINEITSNITILIHK